MKKIVVSILLLLFGFSAMTQQTLIEKRKGRNRYVKQQMESMSLKQMVGQMIMIDSYAKDDSNYYKNILYQIDSNFVGGVCFFKGTQKDLLKLNKLYDSHAEIPLFVAIDGEWGLNMRLSEMETFPLNMTLGALPKNKYHLVKDMACVIAKECKSLGININFAPVVDININPNNPVINMRSFGQDKYKVSILAREYVKGLQENGIMAVVKHFPGHGDTETDSHKATPIIKHNKSFIDSVDVYPFRYNINKGAWATMVGHLQVPALSEDSLKVATINKDIITDYLQEDLGFEGLVFTDAMNMKGLTNLYADGEAEVLAILAGVDILLMPENTDKAIETIINAIEENKIPKQLIEQKCKKILSWKYDMGLVANRGKYFPIDSNLYEKTKELNEQIAENTVTLLDNKGQVSRKTDLSFTNKDTVSLVLLGNVGFEVLTSNLTTDIPTKIYRIHSKMKDKEVDSIIFAIDSTKTIITAFGGARFSNSKSNYGIPDISIGVLNKIEKKCKDNIILMFCNPYTLKLIDSSFECKAFVLAYENNNYTQKAVAKFLNGEIKARGSLPVSIKRTHIINEQEELNGISSEEKFYMDNNINLSTIKKIDSIAQNGITEKAYPGCQVLIAKDGKIIYNKNFGYHTYDKQREVTSNTMYDIASLTKIMATTIAIMRLYEEEKIKLDAQISDYIPELKKSEVGKLTIKELLSHYTTLPAVYPFAQKKLKGKNIHQAILKEMKHISLKQKKYTYSDLNFLLLQYALENITNEGLDEYVQREFYSKMNLQNTTFNPLLNGVNQENIAPTENDTTTRKELIWGQVHDPLAYLNNGVCGNAGLFSTTEDLFKICQMLLNKGEFEGVRYLDSATIDIFNHRYFADLGIRRALGFDKPLLKGKSSHCSQYASQSSFGHSGFTGTYIWIEPKNNTIIIFLSNRVYPHSSPNKLSKMNIRTDINDLIYQL